MVMFSVTKNVHVHTIILIFDLEKIIQIDKEENRALEMQVQTLKRELNDLKTSSIGKHTSNTPLVTIKTLLNKLTKGQKKRIKSVYGSDCFSNITEEQLRTIWKNPEIQKYIQQNN